jgi:hypothetical protein
VDDGNGPQETAVGAVAGVKDKAQAQRDAAKKAAEAELARRSAEGSEQRAKSNQ